MPLNSPAEHIPGFEYRATPDIMRFMFHELVEERNRERCITVTVGLLDQTLVAVAIFTVFTPENDSNEILTP
jgi:hypothetical protein